MANETENEQVNPAEQAAGGVLLPKNLNDEIAQVTNAITALIATNSRLQQLYNICYSELENHINHLTVANQTIAQLKQELAKIQNPATD